MADESKLLGDQPVIGTGIGWAIASAACFAVGLFALAASSGGERSAAVVSMLALPAAPALGLVALAVRLAGVIERRLMAIERSVGER